MRAGQTEGSVDLARLAGIKHAAVICEIMRDDGEMARMPDLEIFAEKHGLHIATIKDIIKYRMDRGQVAGAPGRRSQHADQVRRLPYLRL